MQSEQQQNKSNIQKFDSENSQNYLKQFKQSIQKSSNRKQDKKDPINTQIKESRKYQIVLSKCQPRDRLSSVLRTNNAYSYRNCLFIDADIFKGQQDGDSSFTEMIFDFKKANKIDLNKDYIRVFLVDRQTSRLPMRYFIEKLRSMGDQRLFQLSNLIQKLDSIIDRVSQIMLKRTYSYSQQSLQQVLKPLQGKSYFLMHSLYQNKQLTIKSFIFSLGLIKTMGYDLEQLAIKYTRLGAIRGLNIFSKGSIYQMTYFYLDKIYQFHLKILEHIFPQNIEQQMIQAKQEARLDFYNSKGQKMIGIVDMFMPNPFYFAFVLKNITSITNQFQFKRTPRRNIQIQYKREMNEESRSVSVTPFVYKEQNRELILQQEKALNQIGKFPKKTLLMNQGRVSKYRQIEMKDQASQQKQEKKQKDKQQ